MNIEKTSIDGLYIIDPKVFGDNRGWFCETYSQKTFEEAGLYADFVQDNHSFSEKKNILRGMHFQINPVSQIKLIRCTRGAVMDVVVDLRKNSPTYLKHEKVELTADNHKMFWIPKGFAHGFLTLTENCEIQYKVDALYSPEHDRSMLFSDQSVGIDWGIDNPIMSDKDKNAPLLKDIEINF